VSNNSSRLVAFIGFALAAICLCVSPTPLRAQTVNGTILGVIQDQQGAVIAGAEVSARNMETGAVRKTIADETGSYRIFSIPAGRGHYMPRERPPA
jgi:hypothetical protein